MVIVSRVRIFSKLEKIVDMKPWFWKIKVSGGSIYIPAEVNNPVKDYEVKEDGLDPFNSTPTDYLDPEKRIRTMINLLEKPPHKVNYDYVYGLAEDLFSATKDNRLIEPMDDFYKKYIITKGEGTDEV